MTDSTERFSSRVENYIRYRPRYPVGVIDCLRADCGLSDQSTIADIGSGTGMLSELFLDNGNLVFGVEPNAGMRKAGERLLANWAGFRSVDGTAEQTGLPDEVAGFVTAGQAFHWFDREKARHEFKRILKPGGWTVLVWNERATGSALAHDYEQLLVQFATDYEAVNQRSMGDHALREFFGSTFVARTLENSQRFDFDALQGRLLSSSYAPEAGHPQHAPMLAALRRVFDAHEINGEVTFEYDTNLYYGRL